MLLNRDRQLWFRETVSSGESLWLPLGAGFKGRKLEEKSEKLPFYEVGKEDEPQEEILSTVKVLTFYTDYDEDDPALRSLLAQNGRELFLLEGKKGDDKALSYRCILCISEEGGGDPRAPISLKIAFQILAEERGILLNAVNGLTFTAEN